MKAVITGENDERVGVNLLDNNDAEHVIEMEFDGEIKYYEQDGYPDEPSERSPDGSRHVTQAQHYAKYYVYQEKGYQTIPAREDPDRLTIAALVLSAMDTDTFEEYFGPFYQQFKHHTEDAEPAIEIPEKLYTEDVFYYYAMDIYLGFGRDGIAKLVEQFDEPVVQEYLDEAERVLAGGDAATVADELTALASEHGLAEREQALEPADWIEATSGLHIKWQIGDELYGELNDEPAIDRGPDAQLELIPHNPDSLEALQEYAVHNLKCQARDCYVQMGVTPPEPLQVTGPGMNRLTDWYQRFADSFQPYHDPDAEIDWENV
ncbi:hypothetical protein [Natrinema pallidum]|uniref:Uncharacterized protein n=1 Tax=Natrinema pallidum DSM 3751 TaxID=1227495 RepID=L9YZG5_9EURY|nr:hypothetical protein [Natrinema pallidum]ELY78333.1 hypothetical protein C487_08694 [Natrinema pallidum DSM 3751]